MTINRFRSSISDGTRVELALPVGHEAYDLNGKSALVLRCMGCFDEERTPDTIDYMVRVDGASSIIVIPATWIVEPDDR